MRCVRPPTRQIHPMTMAAGDGWVGPELQPVDHSHTGLLGSPFPSSCGQPPAIRPVLVPDRPPVRAGLDDLANQWPGTGRQNQTPPDDAHLTLMSCTRQLKER